jgi:hypothetical protein
MLIRKLSNVSLVAVATTEVEAAVKAIEHSLRGLNFERTILFSHYNPRPDSKLYDFVKISKFDSISEWGYFVVFDLHKYISTGHIVLIHADGFIVNPGAWNDEFLQYDYIGAPWPVPKDSFSFRDYFGNIIRVGNSVSLRSRRLLKMPSDLELEWKSDHGYFHEDGFLCALNRHILQKHGIEYAPLHVACKFSHEKPIPETKGIKPFAFHKWEGANSVYPRFTEKEKMRTKIFRGLGNVVGRVVK